MSDTPKQGEEILSIADDHGWATNETWEKMPATMNFDDGSSRTVDTDTYQIVGSKDKTMFMVGWYVNPFTDRWNLSLKHAILITANEIEMRIADAMDLLPQYVYWDHMSLKHFKAWLASEDPQGTLEDWHERYDIKEEDA